MDSRFVVLLGFLNLFIITKVEPIWLIKVESKYFWMGKFVIDIVNYDNQEL